jgi:hypothetical protein
VAKTKQAEESTTIDVESPEGRKQIIDAAITGDTAYLEQFKQIIKTHGNEVLARTNFSKTIRSLYLEAAFPTNLAGRTALELKVKDMQQELEGPNPSPLEKLLVERVIVTWLNLFYAECQRGAYLKRKEWEFSGAIVRDRRVERAQALHLKAIKALAQIRRLQIPVLAQFNIYPGESVPEEIRPTDPKVKP